ncbi:hypothetical protein Daura_01810 [Dactylosporangium aurantiacum]|uniref:Guanylate cyclase domain-containing protein n=1 Tax=Dactylosporangium aurantiacum TaxID=35754 RepID=A0A9Q9MJU9_9ACTN|nr:hypothetical protein [Dactylosporangium aurantiacum]MDG6100898.1 hypothetical protein [Dactylosporangium aurantiacum]UWZ55046.1 hypothetical protein Daura_01810 [Dactylosporangium aurantiacum]
MSEPVHPRRCVLVAVDMERYSPRDNLRQYQAQHLFREVMAEAVAGIGLDRDSWTTQQSGDGELAILPADASELTVVADFVPALDRVLRERNRNLLPEAKVRLRVAIHQGLVHLTGANGFPGEAVVEVSRLLDADPLRRALTTFPRASVALIVSRSIFQDVVRHGYRGLRPERFRQVRVAVKQLTMDAWICVPDEDVSGVDWDRPAPPETGPAAAPPEPRPAAAQPPVRTEPAPATYQISGVTTNGPAVFGPGGTAIGTVHGHWNGRTDQ